MCSANRNDILPEPTEELKQLSAELANRIRQKIVQHGPLAFSEYMEMALYEPGLGYYSAGLQKFGEGGDFVTAPQLGSVFARCLARQVEQVGATLGHYEIVEAGAGSGILAADLLKALQDIGPPVRYRILERSAHLRQVQKETLEQYVPGWMDRISWLDEPPAEKWQGVFLANEVLDALVVERFCIGEDGPLMMRVTTGPDGFEWLESPCPEEVHRRIEAIFSGLGHYPATGYRSEINTSLPAWLNAVTASLDKGLALFVDYGYARREFYGPQRSDGTLICHYRQRAHGDPFKWPGLTDMCGLEVSGYTTQSMFLLACGMDEMIAGTDSLPASERISINSQVRRLTLPGEMGERFQAMALSRGLDDDLAEDLRGFSIFDLCHRL